MKKMIVFLWLLLFLGIAYSAPDKQMSIPNSFSANTTISSSATNANNNHISSQYNTHSHTTDIAGTSISTTPQGSVLYFSATGVVSMLSPGTSGQFLQTQGTGANPQWASVGAPFVGTFTRDTSAASGNQTVAGVGFTPSLVLLFAETQSTEASFGFGTASTYVSVSDNSGSVANTWTSQANAIYLIESGANTYQGNISSFNSDGFVIAWTKVGTPTGTANIRYTAFR